MPLTPKMNIMKLKKVKDLDQIQQDEEKCPKTKSIIEFDPSLACSIKSFAVKKKRLNKTNYQIF